MWYCFCIHLYVTICKKLDPGMHIDMHWFPSENRVWKKASLNHGFPPVSEKARLLEPPFCHNAPLFVRVSLGRVWGQVEIFRKVRYAPLATTATRTSYVIYLQNRSKIIKAYRKRRLRRNTWSLEIGFSLIHQLVHDTWIRSPPGSYLDLASSSGNSNVVFLARFPRRLGRP
jgi:hypothetical protein